MRAASKLQDRQRPQAVASDCMRTRKPRRAFVQPAGPHNRALPDSLRAVSRDANLRSSIEFSFGIWRRQTTGELRSRPAHRGPASCGAGLTARWRHMLPPQFASGELACRFPVFPSGTAAGFPATIQPRDANTIGSRNSDRTHGSVIRFDESRSEIGKSMVGYFVNPYGCSKKKFVQVLMKL